MATSVSLNNVTYSIPANGETNWGSNVSSYLIALSTGVLQKAGGSFTLTADVDFGASYGLKSVYYKSRGTASSAGILRLANNESVGWRNAANSADKLLKVNTSDQLEFDGVPVAALSLGAANTVFRMNSGGTAFEYAKLVAANIDSAAAIAASQLAALTASRLMVTDASGFMSASSITSTEAGYLSGVTSAIQTQMDAKAATVTTTRGDLIRRGASADERFTAVTDNRVVRGDGTDVVSGQIDDPNFFTTGAEVTQSLPGVVKSAGQLLGTNTNDAAATGYVGETDSVFGVGSSTVNLSDMTVANISDTLTLGPGNWQVEGYAIFDSAGAATIDLYSASISDTSATLDSTANRLTQMANADGTVLADVGRVGLYVPIGPTLYSVAAAGSTTLRITARVGVVAGTTRGKGYIRKRRIR